MSAASKHAIIFGAQGAEQVRPGSFSACCIDISPPVTLFDSVDVVCLVAAENSTGCSLQVGDVPYFARRLGQAQKKTNNESKIGNILMEMRGTNVAGGSLKPRVSQGGNGTRVPTGQEPAGDSYSHSQSNPCRSNIRRNSC